MDKYITTIDMKNMVLKSQEHVELDCQRPASTKKDMNDVVLIVTIWFDDIQRHQKGCILMPLSMKVTTAKMPCKRILRYSPQN
jgi:hypothetical protein